MTDDQVSENLWAEWLGDGSEEYPYRLHLMFDNGARIASETLTEEQVERLLEIIHHGER